MILVFAEALLFLTENEQDLGEILTKMTNNLQLVGLEVNQEKTASFFKIPFNLHQDKSNSFMATFKSITQKKSNTSVSSWKMGDVDQKSQKADSIKQWKSTKYCYPFQELCNLQKPLHHRAIHHYWHPSWHMELKQPHWQK
jgi:hypothetical protein